MTSVLDELPSDLDISPQAVASYLGVAGWELESADAASQVWTLREGSRTRAEVFLPLDNTYADFKRRFDITLKRLRRVYDWDSFQLATSVLGARSDLLFIRADQEIQFDSIPLKQAEQLVVGASHLMTAAAWATVDNRPAPGGHKPEQIRRFIEDDVRMGHTQRGSFVLTIITRLDELELSEAAQQGAGSPDDGETRRRPPSASDDATTTQYAPFQRRVTSTLANGLNETSRLVNSSRSPELNTAVDAGVNALLCDSIQEMGQFAGLRALDLSFQWAPADTRSRPEIERVLFQKEKFADIRSISDRLKERSEVARIEILGRVTRLERPEGSHDENEILATIRGKFEKNRERVFQAVLEGGAKDLAIRAFREHLPVIVAGNVDLSQQRLKFSGRVHMELLP